MLQIAPAPDSSATLQRGLSYVAKGTKWIECLGELLDEDEYANDPFVRRLRKSERGREILADRMQESVQ